jgi:hypothetical protein
MAGEVEFGELGIEAPAAGGLGHGGRPHLGNGRSTVLQVRLDPETRAQLDDRAEHDHSAACAMAREAIRGVPECVVALLISLIHDQRWNR